MVENETLPPLVPPEADLRGLQFMPLDVVRLMDSDLFALTTGDEFKAAVALWCKAWLQLPAASLPDDDRVLAHLSGAGPRWNKIRSMALRGFVKCSDGRLYHPVIAEKAIDAWEMRLRQRERSAKGNAKRWGQTSPSNCDPHGDPHGDRRKDSFGDRKGQGQGQGELIKNNQQQPCPTRDGQAAAAPGKVFSKADRDRMEAELRRAGTHENAPSAGFFVLEPILGLMDQGADFEGDILPAIRAKPNPRANGWGYYVPQIQEFRAKRASARNSVLPLIVGETMRSIAFRTSKPAANF